MKSTVLILLLAFPILAQTSDLDRAIDYYRNGNLASSMVILEKLSKGTGKNDGLVWNYIGLCNIKFDDFKTAEIALAKAVKLKPQDSTIQANYGFALLLRQKREKAIKAFTKALELDPSNAAAYFMRGTGLYWDSDFDEALADANRAIAIKADFPVAYNLKSNTLIAQFGKVLRARTGADVNTELLRAAIETLDGCNLVCNDAEGKAARDARIKGLRVFETYFAGGKTVDSDANGSAGPNVVRLRILRSPAPRYTDAARRSNVQGVIRVLVLFDANGRVTQTMPLNSLGYGLDESALTAASLIAFVPATKNGAPFPVVRTIEYNFSIY